MNVSNIKIPYPQIINELSFQPAITQKIFADQMRDLYGLMKEMKKIGFCWNAKFSKSLYNRICFEQTTFYDWLKNKQPESSEERETKKALLSLFAKVQFIEDSILPDMPEEDLFFQEERLYPLSTADGTRIVPGLVASYIWGLPSISCCVAEYAHGTSFEIKVSSMNENAEIENTVQKIISISKKKSVPLIINEIRQRILREIKTGNDILSLHNELFPNLSFSSNAESQLRSLSPAITHGFSWFCDILFKLNYAVYKVKAIEANSIDFFRTEEICNMARREAQSTQNDKICKKTHTFVWADGKSHVCFSHAKNKALNLRLYFNYDNEEKLVYIGHIGEHLPISSGKY